MIEQQGRVVGVRGDRADITIGATTGCTACASGQGCGAGIFGKLWRRKPVLFTIENSISARPGQSVMVGIAERTFLRLVARLYFVPLLAALVGGIAGQWLVGLTRFASKAGPLAADLGALLGATVLCGLALWFLRHGPGPRTADVEVKLLRVVTGLPGIECGNGVGAMQP